MSGLPLRFRTGVKPSVMEAFFPHPLRTIYFYLTAGCNLRCRHCWLTPKHEAGEPQYPYLDPVLFAEIIEQGLELGLQRIKLTGGEPLLHPQVAELIALAHRHGLRLTMETNGVLCSPGIAAAIAACREPFVAVSLDGTEAATHEWVRGVAGSFEGALAGVRRLAAAGLRPQLIMAVMRHNRGQMAALVRLAEDLGAGSVKFNVVMPTGRGEGMHARDETLSIGELVEVGRWVEEELAPASRIKVFFDHPAAFRPLGRSFGERGDGCGACGIKSVLGVLADGSYALCGIGQTLPEMVFGQAGRDPLRVVWEEHPVLREIRPGLPGRLKGICADCLMNRVCLGGCLAQNYYRTGDLWAPFWYCEQAAAAGLFPETRLAVKPSPPNEGLG